MIVDEQGYRLNVGIILVNDAGRVFVGRRIGHDTWQFPQGGVGEGESPEEAMTRELDEEIGLMAEDIEILGCTKHWLRYRLPKQYIRHNQKPLVIGQKQKWFLLKLISSEQKIRLDVSESPEFDSWRWTDYSQPSKDVIYFKQQVYRQALKELKPLLKETIEQQEMSLP